MSMAYGIGVRVGSFVGCISQAGGLLTPFYGSRGYMEGTSTV